MTLSSTLLRLAALAAGLAATAVHAAPDPTGVWIDHTGRGAVEIAECNGGLCGHVVWIKDAKNSKACRTQILGNVKSVGANTWDRGWIVDPDDNQRYSVELKPVGEDRLRVTGYMGSKLFSETMLWKRAPADLKRCDGKDAATPAPTVVAAPAPALSPIEPAAPAPQPQREAAAPPVFVPGFAPPPAEPSVVAPAPPQPRATPNAASPRSRISQADTPAQPEPQADRPSKRRSSSRDCKLDLPYITLKYPCDAF